MKITYTDVQPLVEALKEGGRIAAISAIPLIIDGLNRGSVDWRAIVVVVAVTILKSIDKFLHLTGKVEGNDSLTAGLTRF